MMKYEFLDGNKRGYTLFNRDGVYFKGYLVFDQDNGVIKGEEALNYICKNIRTKTDLTDLLKKTDGCFALTIIREDIVMAAVDRARSMPIYYSRNILSDSSEAIRKKLGIKNQAVDETSLYEFRESDYVEFEETVYREIKQLDAGQILCVKGNEINTEYYYRHYEKIVDIQGELTKMLHQVSLEEFNKLKRIINDRCVVLSLSGGYDSRYIGIMLKEVGIKNVKCYTYGKRDSFEVKQSHTVAEALGFDWTCVEYTDELIEDAINDQGYFDYCNEHDYIIYLQNYPAVKKLVKEGWIPKDSVFVTGLCGDMPTGNYVREPDPTRRYDKETLINELIQHKFIRSGISERFKPSFEKKYREAIERVGIDIVDYQTYIQVLDCIETCGPHSRCFLHMNRCHEYFGYEWLLPFWSKELLSFWYSLPYTYRVRQNFYEMYLTEDLGEKYGIGTKKYRATYSNNEAMNKIKHIVGGMLVYCCFKMGIPFRRSYDYNNFSYGELLLYKKIRNKKGINYQKAGFVHLLNRYIVEQRYLYDHENVRD